MTETEQCLSFWTEERHRWQENLKGGLQKPFGLQCDHYLDYDDSFLHMYRHISMKIYIYIYISINVYNVKYRQFTDYQ